MFYSNSNSQRFQIYAGKMNAKRPTCPVGSIPSKAGTPQDRVWGHTRAKIFRCHVVAVTRAGDHAHAIIPVGTTVSVHGWLPSPFRVVTHITLYCSRHREICQGNRGFVYNSFTCGGIMQEKRGCSEKKSETEVSEQGTSLRVVYYILLYLSTMKKKRTIHKSKISKKRTSRLLRRSLCETLEVYSVVTLSSK